MAGRTRTESLSGVSSFRIIGREEWGCRKVPSKQMSLPAREVWLHHSVTSVSDDPMKDMRAVETIGLQRFGHISYSYCFHPSGVVLVGAGLQVGAHTAGRNSTSFGLCLIGNYEERAVTLEQKMAVRAVIAILIEQGHLRPGIYPSGGHRDLKATACPGDRAYAVLNELREPWAPEMTGEEDEDMERPVDALQDPQGGIWVLSANGAVRNYRGARHLGEPKGQGYWGGREASHFEANDKVDAQGRQGGYDVLAATGERYSYPTG